jgi:hypothetical protein
MPRLYPGAQAWDDAPTEGKGDASREQPPGRR